MNYVGIDWADGRAAFCAMGEGGEIAAEGLIPANEDGLARLVLEQGTEVRAAVEMMSGAVWVRDRLEASGWKVQVAHARKVRDVAPLACKTDQVDARVLAELCRRDLVPELWVPSIEDRALRERLRRRAHLVKTRGPRPATGSSGCSPSSPSDLPRPASQARRDRAAGAPRGARGLAGLDLRAARAGRGDGPADRPDRPRAGPDRKIRRAGEAAGDDAGGVGPLLSLTFAAEIGEVSRFASPGKLIGYAGLAPRISQSGERSATGALSKAGSRTLRWAAVEAANQAWRPSNQAWRPSNPWPAHYARISERHGKNPAKSAVVRKLLIAAWHMLSRREPFKEPASANSGCFLTP